MILELFEVERLCEVHIHFVITSGDQAWASRPHKHIAASSKKPSSVETFFVERISAKQNVHVGVKNHTEPKLLKRKRMNLGLVSLQHLQPFILVTWMQASFPAQSRTFKRHGSSVASPSGVTQHPTCFTALCHQCIQTNWAISTICWVSPWKRNSSSKTKELKASACPGVPMLDFRRTRHTQVRPLYSPQSHLIRHLLRGSPCFNLTHLLKST